MSQLLKFINENTDGEFETIKTKLTSEDIKLIVKEDPDDNLWLARYKKQVFNRDIHDFVPHSNMELDFVQQSRGIILEKGSNRIVCYPPDASVSYDKIWEENISDMSFHLAIEGTQVTLYNYNGRWGISTKGAINSANSRWMSSRSFLDMFLDAASEADLNYSILNKNYCYTFILCHPENKIINTIRSPCLYHIHTRDLTTLNEVEVTIENDKIYKPKQYNTIESKEDFASVMEMFVDYPGLGVIIKNSKGEMHRVEGALYSRLREIKSNNRNIYFRMLELHCAGRFDDVNLFLQFFPEYLQGIQDMTGVRIPKLINTLYYYYHHCKVKKNYVPNMEKWIHRALFKIHGAYLKMVQDGVEKPFITKQVIFEEYVSKLPYHYLYTLLFPKNKKEN